MPEMVGENQNHHDDDGGHAPTKPFGVKPPRRADQRDDDSEHHGSRPLRLRHRRFPAFRFRVTTGALSYAYVPVVAGFAYRLRWAVFFGFGGFGIAFRLPGVPGGGGGVWSNALMLPSRSSGSLSRSRFAITPRESDRHFSR